MLMPAAHKKEYHSAFPGGYVDHVNRVVHAALINVRCLEIFWVQIWIHLQLKN
jgi:hypothetical protein